MLLAVELRVMEALARMFPTKLVPLPSVALLPTSQVTLLLQEVAPLMSTTAALLAVMSMLPILKSHAAVGFPLASRGRVPVTPIDVLVKQ